LLEKVLSSEVSGKGEDGATNTSKSSLTLVSLAKAALEELVHAMTTFSGLFAALMLRVVGRKGAADAGSSGSWREKIPCPPDAASSGLASTKLMATSSPDGGSPPAATWRLRSW
jgi:hypothetical protein